MPRAVGSAWIGDETATQISRLAARPGSLLRKGAMMLGTVDNAQNPRRGNPASLTVREGKAA